MACPIHHSATICEETPASRLSACMPAGHCQPTDALRPREAPAPLRGVRQARALSSNTAHGSSFGDLLSRESRCRRTRRLWSVPRFRREPTPLNTLASAPRVARREALWLRPSLGPIKLVVFPYEPPLAPWPLGMCSRRSLPPVAVPPSKNLDSSGRLPVWRIPPLSSVLSATLAADFSIFFAEAVFFRLVP